MAIVFALAAVALLFGAAACSLPNFTDKRERQDEAIDIVWHGIYGMTGDPPTIRWIRANTEGFDRAGFTLGDSEVQICIGDPADPQLWHHFLADGGWPISETSFCHELMHARTFIKTGGDVDAAHVRGDWSLVDDAVEALSKAGL
jgi:hypothetical protein